LNTINKFLFIYLIIISFVYLNAPQCI